MALFVVRDQHDPARCPAADPMAGARFLNHLNGAEVSRHGVRLRAEAVVQGEHTLYLIVEARDEDHVWAFLEPFVASGTVDVYPASTCARVVANGGCAEPPPALDAGVPVMDPEGACQDALDAGLVVHRAHPLNCETSIPALLGGVVMPNARFYVRNHFPMPALDAAAWRLAVFGLVDRPLALSLRELRDMASQSRVVTLECAGNGRALLSPSVAGEPWGLGAVSTAEWTGVPLVEVLDRAGVRSGAREVVFRGADRGRSDETPATTRFERSLSLDDARGADVLLAYAMNGEPLPIQHGYPLRVIVPGWYAVASVKWLTEVEVIDAPFTGFFQAERYFYRWERDNSVEPEPVSMQRVRALITEPASTEEVTRGGLTVRGVAWSGAAPIARVDVRLGEGEWRAARLVGDRHRYSWRWWELLTRVDRAGPITLRARATDLAGQTQPERPRWNRLGYGANPIHAVPILVR